MTGGALEPGYKAGRRAAKSTRQGCAAVASAVRRFATTQFPDRSPMRLNAILARLLSTSMLWTLPAAAAGLTAQTLVTLDRLGAPATSADGSRVAYTVRHVDLAADRTTTTLVVQGTRPGEAGRTFTLPCPGFHGVGEPQWSGAGSVVVIGHCEGPDQLWRVGPDGGAQALTHLPLDVQAYRLSPDGRHAVVALAVFADEEKPGADALDATRRRLDARAADHATGMVFDRLFVRHWDTWADGTRNHLYAVDLDGHTPPVPLMAGFDGDVPGKPFGDESDFTVSPDGRSVFFSARLAGRSEPWSTNFDIYRVGLDGHTAPEDLTAANKAWDGGPVLSPDGRSLAWRAMKRPGFEADRFGIMIRDLATGTTREIAPHWDRSAQSLLFSADGRTLYATADDLGSLRAFAVDIATGTVRRLTGDGHVGAVLAGPAGQLVIDRDAMDSPAQLWSLALPAPGVTGDARIVRLTDVGGAQLASTTFAPWQQFAFPGWNGETVHGYVVWPADFRPGHRYPVAFLIHGGPQGSFGDDWSYRWNPQFYAGLGYAAVMIDFHGSTGYGQGFTDAISGHWGDRPLEDLRKGWAWALAHFDFLDGDRACALGASYGGFMVNWIAGNWNQPWKCLVTHDGVFDDRMMGFSTEELWFSEWEHGGPGHTPWSDPAAYERFNPADHVAAWRVPQLVIHGGRDYRIPLEQGLGAFTALQRRGIDSRLLVFPAENHWVLKPADSLMWHRVVADWLAAHLHPAQTPAP